jgi:glutamate dehydrogenase
MTDEVAALVLRDNYEQTQALSTSVAQAASMVDVHARYIRSLEQSGRLDRALEFLPDDETLAERKTAGRGLTAPEFAILLSYTKIALYAELLASDLPDDPQVAGELDHYFPVPLVQRFRSRLARHPLRREIVADQLTNTLVNRAGTTFVFRLREETGAGGPDIARAFVVARDVFDLGSLWDEVEALDGQVSAETQLLMLLKARVLHERATRWLLRNRPRPIDIAAGTARYAPAVASLVAAAGTVAGADDRAAARRIADGLVGAGVPSALAERIGRLDALLPALDIVEAAAVTGLGFDDVAAVYFAIDDRLELHALRGLIAALPREERWDALARRALWEDLQSEHRALTIDVLQSSSGPVERRLVDWMTVNAGAVERCVQVLADVRAGGTADLATLSVAVRELRNLIDATAPAAAAPPGPSGNGAAVDTPVTSTRES